MTELVKFNYAELSQEDQIAVRTQAQAIRTVVRRTAQGIFEIGESLCDVHDRLAKRGDGVFQAWLKAEFNWSMSAAYRFMRVYQRLGVYANLTQISISTTALYILAEPDTPDSVIDEILGLGLSGKSITPTVVQSSVAHHAPKFKLGQKVRANGTIYLVSGITSGGRYTLRPVLSGPLKNDVAEDQIEVLDTPPALTAPVIQSFPAAQPDPGQSRITEISASLVQPNQSSNPPTSRPQQSDVQIEIAAKLSTANLTPFRIVAHTNGHSGTFSAGFDSQANTRQQANEEAKTYGDVMQMLGFVVLNAGVDIAPGYQSLSMSGQHTPIVHFGLPGYQPPDSAESHGRTKPKNNRTSEDESPVFDRCQTPAYALTPLLPYLQARPVIWEPAAGKGRLVAALQAVGADVIATDILDGKDFFDFEPESYDLIITNPPYSKKYRWLERCYELGKPFALLIPGESLFAASGAVQFQEHGIEIVVMYPRVDFDMPEAGFDGSGAQFPTAWFTWGFNIGRALTFVNIGDEKAAFKQSLLTMEVNG